MKNLLVVFPTAWDRKQLDACGASWRDRYAIHFASPMDEDCPADFDVLEFIATSIHDRTVTWDGVLSSSDYPGAVVAAAIAAGLGRAGATPEAVLRCAHKYAARQALLPVVPEALPQFALVDPDRPQAVLQWLPANERTDEAVVTGFPCFVKPVKGAFSVLSKRVESQTELAEFLARPCIQEFTSDYLGIFHALQARYAPAWPSARHFLAEGLLAGEQVTVEGYSCGGQVEFLGIVDSVMHPGTRSFARFEYPSSLPAAVQERMRGIVRRAIAGIGLDNTLFNVEMTYDAATDRIGIIEINPRMCGQFADLYEKVDGTNSYAVALALAAGERPVVRQREGRYRAAASLPLRIFEPVRVVRAPGAADVRAAEALFPGTLAWVECEPGQSLCDFDSMEDGCSARYAIINLGGNDRDTLIERFEAVGSRLGFGFEAVQSGQSDAVGSGSRPRADV